MRTAPVAVEDVSALAWAAQALSVRTAPVAVEDNTGWLPVQLVLSCKVVLSLQALPMAKVEKHLVRAAKSSLPKFAASSMCAEDLAECTELCDGTGCRRLSMNAVDSCVVGDSRSPDGPLRNHAEIG